MEWMISVYCTKIWSVFKNKFLIFLSIFLCCYLSQTLFPTFIPQRFQQNLWGWASHICCMCSNVNTFHTHMVCVSSASSLIFLRSIPWYRDSPQTLYTEHCGSIKIKGLRELENNWQRYQELNGLQFHLLSWFLYILEAYI